MSSYFQTAKQAISDNDKNRILAIYLNTNAGVTDLEKASADFGSKSAESMKVMTRSIIKKIEMAGGKEGEEATTTNPAKGGKKRKTAGDGVDGTPTPKKRGKTSKKAKQAVVKAAADNDDNEEENKVKTEPEADEEAEAEADVEV